MNDFDTFWSLERASEEDRLAKGFEKLAIEEIEKRNYISIPRLYNKITFEKEEW